MSITQHTHDGLKTLRRCLPEAAEALKLDLGDTCRHWTQTLDHKLLPRIGADFPLVAAICGGGSTGKSTLFNALIGQPVSPAGGKAGLNRRVLVGIPKALKDQHGLFDYLGHTYGTLPERLRQPEDLCSPGPPLYCDSDILPGRMVLLDTPDIDTGAQGHYTNRDLARQSLEVADLFIYIFTNSTYNNLDNSDFIARMFTGMGTRPCFLIYRVYPSFSDSEVRDHARTVARNIYGTTAQDNVLGLFRADEDNAVAAGEKAMSVRSVNDGASDLITTLADLDPSMIRSGVLASMLDDTVAHARQMANDITRSVAKMNAYRRALAAEQDDCVRHSLSKFPLDRVLRRFAQIWRESDPTHIKVMRRTGKVVEWPLKTVIKTVRRFNDPNQNKTPPTSAEKLSRQLEMDLLTAANRLYKSSLDTEIAINGETAAVPSIVKPAQEHLAQKPWDATLRFISEQKEEVLSWSTQLDDELRTLADNLRSRMGIMDQIRQTFAAMLNVIPATAAITYILHTGDPMGAAGIKVKLTGLFGLHDLYALIAIPATAGMSKADRKQLELLLNPLARTWLAHKLNMVQALFKDQISGEILASLEQAIGTMDRLDDEISDALAKLTV